MAEGTHCPACANHAVLDGDGCTCGKGLALQHVRRCPRGETAGFDATACPQWQPASSFVAATVSDGRRYPTVAELKARQQLRQARPKRKRRW